MPRSDSRPETPTTCHHMPWALVRRAGDQIGKRPSTRMAFLVGTVAPEGRAVALTGYVMNNDMTGWTKRPVRIEWADLVKQWRRRPTAADVRKVKAKMPIIKAEAERWNWGGRDAAQVGA
jgi:hypothetical protein